MINRRRFLTAAGAAAALGPAAIARQTTGSTFQLSIDPETSPSAKKSGTAQRKHPNLLFILADQLGRNHCGYAGARLAKTPNIDTLAKQGIDFVNTVASMPVCSAFRASFLTGKYTTSTGMVINELRMNTNHTCLGHVVTRAGYDTCYIGKWHLYANELGNHADPKNSFTPPGPDRLGFDGEWASYGFHHEYYNTYYHRDTPDKIPYGEGVYEPDGQTDLMIDYLRRQKEGEKPFCAILSYGTPHDPWNDENVPAEYRQMFSASDFPNPPNYLPENDPYGDNWAKIRPEHRPLLSKWRANYYAMTANLDHNIGRLMNALKENGLDEETIVVFSSDHGEMFGAHGRRAKNIFYDEAARIPFTVRWPGKIAAGSRSDACISNVDFMPTLLGLMGLPIPGDVEGMDCSAVATGKKDGPQPEAALLQNTSACAAWTEGHEWRGLRDKRYTYAIYRVDKSELLFDNIADPLQVKNLASDPAHADTVKRFRAMLAKKMKAINDTNETGFWYRDNWTKDRMIVRTATMG